MTLSTRGPLVVGLRPFEGGSLAQTEHPVTGKAGDLEITRISVGLYSKRLIKHGLTREGEHSAGRVWLAGRVIDRYLGYAPAVRQLRKRCGEAVAEGLGRYSLHVSVKLIVARRSEVSHQAKLGQWAVSSVLRVAGLLRYHTAV
jgi:hypothetical protein